MNLHAFRKHLAEELDGIPADAERSFESYAVTTAALARRLLEYLAIDDLSVPDGFRDEPRSYPLRTILDRILHFRVLHQDAITFNVPGMADDAVRVKARPLTSWRRGARTGRCGCRVACMC